MPAVERDRKGGAQRAIRVGLIGFGTIGTGVVKLLERNRAEIRRKLGAALDLVRIADVDIERDRGVALAEGVLVRDAATILDDPSIDIVVELVGGYSVARRFVLEAMEKGKDVVTANKALLAVYGDEIFPAAEKAGVELGFEASVAGGIPIVRTLKEGLCGDDVRAVYGIVNGTCNYILSRMSAEGGDFGEVLREAQREGLAEANPSFDVDGIDAGHKLALLIQLAFGKRVRFEDIPITGIREVSPLDIEFAADFGYVIKALAIAKNDGRHVEARIHPTMVSRKHVLADVNGAINAVVVDSSALDYTMYVGPGAGMMPTATAVVADLMEVARNRLHGCRGRVLPLGYPVARQKAVQIKPMGSLESEYYLRFMVADRPGVLAQIAGILGQHRVSLLSVLQRGQQRRGVIPVVMRTHHAREEQVRRALDEIGRLRVVRGKPMFIRIEESLGQ